ncbi:tetratricopeptide repeat protein [Anaerobacterium chartisolvens]|uniref:Tetratricopeptide repeat protein n=1 Tax=Anaerobacterium chartisolvens TaxID=1297424 RepID=A0A369BHU7_9FIRM|nr:tetratricopeptide repeat protein [Anaerobacterium chartisolvens]RCX20136.1 tetratricopeptide repeat protein [Anaerobacterium chartisolvens]
MISLKQELQDYTSINLDSIGKDDTHLPDNIKNSVMLYNKALESLKGGSEDIAVIELKKAVSMNPDFHEAINLLGICYSYMKEPAKAAEMFQRVIDAEKNSVRAMRYLRLLNSDSLSPDEDRRTGGHKKKDPSMMGRIVKFGDSVKGDAIRYIASAAIGALILFAAGGIAWSVQDRPAAALNNSQIAGDTDNLENDKYRAMYEDLNIKYQKLENSLQTSNAEADYYKNAFKLSEVDRLAAERRYEEAADMLVLLKTVTFKDSEKSAFEQMYNNIIPKAATAMMNEGVKLTNSKKYNDALLKLNKIFVYGNSFNFMDRAIYYTGKCYMGLDDSAKAIAAFEEIVEKYPSGSYAGYSEGWLKSLGAS